MPKGGKTPATRHIPNRRAALAEDAWLAPFLGRIRARADYARQLARKLAQGHDSLADFASGHEFFGLHRISSGGWVFREWAPNAGTVVVIGDFCGWNEAGGIPCVRGENGTWQCGISAETMKHGDLFRLRVRWADGAGDRIPTHARRVVQDPATHIFNAQAWHPPVPYQWRNPVPPAPSAPLIYECHVGMAQEDGRVGGYREFRERVLPRIGASGYNTIQLMAIMEHPYYGSFGYHVSSFFAASSRFGTPEDLKELVDAAHGMGLRVIIDLVHSHAVRNEVEGLGRFDGTAYQFFHEGARGIHQAWDSYCFDYAKPEVLHFLLSNCRFWLDEYRVDGFRFDGITSMLYRDHGLGAAFTDYAQYFDENVDEDALAYLALANQVVHQVRPDAITVAEDVSGMPGLGTPVSEGGCGFDFRLAMGTTDYWFKIMDMRDEDWPMAGLWHEMTNRRRDERTISYVECHDQAIVGGQTMIFRLLGDAMYHAMHRDSQSLVIDRGIALHKMARLFTLATAGAGYLNFMGNEFGHPEWIDFPREGNNWSYHYARRQWSLAGRSELRYGTLAAFDRALMDLARDHDLIATGNPVKIEVNDLDKVIAFERSGLFFFCNFHPSKSLVDRAFPALPGEYDLVLDSDAEDFGGHGRIATGQRYHALAEQDARRGVGTVLRLYLPARCALVLRRCGSG